MTLQEQAWQSGLVFSDDMDNNSDVPQWNFNVWPPILGGWRYSHASVVLDHQEQDDSAQTVVVLGGANHRILFTDSVLLLSLSDENKQWREGPPLSDKRGLHAAVICNGGVYVIGGSIGNSRLDTIERIDVEELLQTYSTSTTGNTRKRKSRMLQSRKLSSRESKRDLLVTGKVYARLLSAITWTSKFSLRNSQGRYQTEKIQTQQWCR